MLDVSDIQLPQWKLNSFFLKLKYFHFFTTLKNSNIINCYFITISSMEKNLQFWELVVGKIAGSFSTCLYAAGSTSTCSMVHVWVHHYMASMLYKTGLHVGLCLHCVAVYQKLLKHETTPSIVCACLDGLHWNRGVAYKVSDSIYPFNEGKWDPS